MSGQAMFSIFSMHRPNFLVVRVFEVAKAAFKIKDALADMPLNDKTVFLHPIDI
jgi:hypothetical protein